MRERSEGNATGSKDKDESRVTGQNEQDSQSKRQPADDDDQPLEPAAAKDEGSGEKRDRTRRRTAIAMRPGLRSSDLMRR